jgi:hypothetical protein
VIAQTGILAGRRKRCVDSTVFDDAVATQDTVTQLVAAVRKAARVVPGAGEVISRVCRLDYSRPGKPGIDWDDPAAREKLVSDLVNDVLAVLAELAGPDGPPRDPAAADALGLLALVAGQDVEPAEGSVGTDGRWRIARKVAPRTGEDWLEQALAYTAVPCKGARAALTRIRPRPARTRTAGPAGGGHGSPAYQLADYLDQHGRAHRASQIPPAEFWSAAAAHATQQFEAIWAEAQPVLAPSGGPRVEAR